MVDSARPSPEANLRAQSEDPPRAEPERGARWLRRPVIVILGVVAVALSARLTIAIPGATVPQSAQTLAVLVIGALLGARDGGVTLVAYLLAGGAGVPVFSDGASGWSHLVGPTAGYLAGFALAATTVGLLADRGVLRRLVPSLAVMMCGHALILSLGWLRLAWTLGAEAAFRQGVAPFVAGGVLKSIVAAVVVVAVTRVGPGGVGR